jgi:hypothetical protein
MDRRALISALGLRAAPRERAQAIQIEREVQIPYGDGSGHGRLDLLVRQGLETLCILEIKTKGFFDEDLDKQHAYSESPAVARGAERIFVAADAQGFNLRGFRFLPWSEVCIRLRRLAPSVAASKSLLTAALFLAFAGAVERNLLGLARSEKDLATLPGTVDHLRECLMPTRS